MIRLMKRQRPRKRRNRGDRTPRSDARVDARGRADIRTMFARPVCDFGDALAVVAGALHPAGMTSSERRQSIVPCGYRTQSWSNRSLRLRVELVVAHALRRRGSGLRGREQGHPWREVDDVALDLRPRSRLQRRDRCSGFRAPASIRASTRAVTEEAEIRRTVAPKDAEERARPYAGRRTNRSSRPARPASSRRSLSRCTRRGPSARLMLAR